MSKTIITDKTVDGAIQKALKEFNVTSKDDLNISILENGSKGFFGIGSKDAKIEVEVKEEEIKIDLTFNVKLDEDKTEKNEISKEDKTEDLDDVIERYNYAEYLAKAFLEKTLNAMDVEAEFEVKRVDKNIEINIKSDKDNVLIGKRGKTLESLEYLTNLAVNKGDGKYINIYLDVAEYKAKRKETLEILANNLAKKVSKTKRRHKLEPMSNYERKIIHSALQNNKYVKTYSEGVEPNRYIVIDVK